MVGVTPQNVGKTQIINPNFNVQNDQNQFAIDQANKILKAKATQKYIDEKIAEGYFLQSDGSLVKISGYTTTTVTINKDTGVVDIKSVTQTPPQQKQSSEYDQLSSKIRKYEQTLRSIDSGKTQASSNARNSIATQLNYLYEARDNLVNTGSAFYMVPGETKTVTETAKADPNVVFDSKGLGYSVAPSLQKDFLAQKEESYKQVSVDLPKQTSSSPGSSSSTFSSQFIAPRTVSGQETISIPLLVDVSNVQTPKTQTFAGVMSASRVGDFARRENTPTSLDLAENKIINALPDTLNPGAVLVASGTVAGIMAPSKLFYNTFTDPEKQVQKIKSGAVEVVKDPFGKLVNEPVMTVINNPLYEGPKLAVEVATLEGASRVAGSVFKIAKESNPYSKFDVQSSAYDLSRSSEKAQVFLKNNQISPSASGGSEFVPLPQLTVDVSKFNKNQRYFSDPALDVPSERQFSLAGTEVKPPLNKPGVLPLTEVTISPFESNKLTIEQIGKKPLIDAVSTAQSRMVDLPVSKTMQGNPVLDLNNPGMSSFISQDLKQTTLVPIENKISSVPKGSDKPFVYNSVKVEPVKPLPDNSFAFESSGPAVSVVESRSVVGTGSRSLTGPEKKLILNSDYVLDSSTGEYVRKVGDVELNLDIKGKVTPQKFGGSGSISLLNPQSKNLESPKLINVQSQNLFQDNKQNTGLDQGSVQSQNNVVDQGSDSKSKSKMVLIQGSAQSQGLSQSSEQSMSSMIGFKQNQVQKLLGSSLSSYDRTDKINPLKPKFLSSAKQKPSGSGSFSVLVRKGGKFQLLGSGYSDLATAFNRGKQEVKNTARASFKVVNNFGGSVGLNVKGDKTLYSSKKESNVVIQKNQFRISSSGEVNEISRKGQASQRKKSKGVFG